MTNLILLTGSLLYVKKLQQYFVNYSWNDGFTQHSIDIITVIKDIMYALYDWV